MYREREIMNIWNLLIIIINKLNYNQIYNQIYKKRRNV